MCGGVSAPTSHLSSSSSGTWRCLAGSRRPPRTSAAFSSVRLSIVDLLIHGARYCFPCGPHHGINYQGNQPSVTDSYNAAVAVIRQPVAAAPITSDLGRGVLLGEAIDQAADALLPHYRVEFRPAVDHQAHAFHEYVVDLLSLALGLDLVIVL